MYPVVVLAFTLGHYLQVTTFMLKGKPSHFNYFNVKHHHTSPYIEFYITLIFAFFFPLLF